MDWTSDLCASTHRTISGTVTDASGAVIPSAPITITNKATSIARTLAANAQGLYSAPALPPGDYEVRTEMQGFRTLVRDALVTAGTTTSVDMSLTIGETREVVNVQAATAQINYESNSVQGVNPAQQHPGIASERPQLPPIIDPGTGE